MITQIYTIRALTNLHVGSSGTNYGIVDKLVQRDATTEHPTIHMSGIKGALRQYFRDKANAEPEEESRKNAKAVILEIFGSDVKDQAAKVKPGKVRFISADLLAFPQPSTSSTVGKPFELVRCLKVAQAFDEKASLFTDWGKWAQTQVQGDNHNEQSDAFAKLTSELPVVARNYLDNGISENLWYEEFVPREAIFATIIQGPADVMADLEKINNQIIQIGGNATVGYGYCLFNLIKPA